MKYIATKSSISKLIFFLVISSLGLIANAHQECQDIKVYTTGGCGSVGSVCVSGKETTQKVCYEVPDGTGPIPGGPAPGSGEGGGGSGGDRPEPPKRPKPAYCNTIEVDKGRCQEDAQTKYRNDSSSCSKWTYGGAALGVGVAVGGAFFTGGSSLIILGAGATGGATGAGTGFLGTSMCESDYLKARDSAFLACETKSKATALDCSTY